LGFNPKAPVENITLTGNTILGRDDGIRILHAKGLTFKNNTVYSGFIRFHSSFYINFNANTWDFSDNRYFTRKNKTIRIQSKEDFTVDEWRKKYGIDSKSTWKTIADFDMKNVLDITPYEYGKNKYRVVLFSKNEEDVTADFSSFNIIKGTNFTIRDVEDHSNVLQSGVLGKDKTITFPMKLNMGDTNKTLDNFGVFIVEFSGPKKVGFLTKLFNKIF